jgi:hypothetical protein
MKQRNPDEYARLARNCGKSWKPTRINHTEQPQRRQGLRALMPRWGRPVCQ